MTEPDSPVAGEFPQYGTPAPVGRTGPEPFDPVEAFKWGWRKFTQHLGPVFIGVAIYVGVRAALAVAGFVLGLVDELGTDMVAAATHGTTAPADLFSATLTVAGLGLTVIDVLVSFVLVAAAIRATLDVTNGLAYDFIAALKRIPLGRVIGANLLVGLIVVAAVGVSLLPGAVALFAGLSPWVTVPMMVILAIPAAAASTAFLYFAIYVIVDQPETGVTDAIGVSASLVRANLSDAFLMGLLGALVMIAGFLACCIGVLAAYPICIFAAAYTYRAFNGQPVAG